MQSDRSYMFSKYLLLFSSLWFSVSLSLTFHVALYFCLSWPWTSHLSPLSSIDHMNAHKQTHRSGCLRSQGKSSDAASAFHVCIWLTAALYGIFVFIWFIYCCKNAHHFMWEIRLPMQGVSIHWKAEYSQILGVRGRQFGWEIWAPWYLRALVDLAVGIAALRITSQKLVNSSCRCS